MTERFKTGDVVRFRGKDTLWVIHSVWHGGTIVHLDLENGGGSAFAIPVTSLEKVG